jgi:hypothetical protein
MHWSQRRLFQKIGESLSFPKVYYSMPINMFFIVKNHWQPYFTDNPRNISTYILADCFKYCMGNFSLKAVCQLRFSVILVHNKAHFREHKWMDFLCIS